MFKDIQVNIDINNIDVGIREWKEVHAKFQRGYELGIEELAIRVEGKIQEYLDMYGLGGSELSSTVHISEVEGGLRVEVGTDYAMYVEYGTGIVGEQSPHPHPWAYDINNHGEQGWQYIGKDGRLHWTMGSEAKPFMYNSWLWAKRSAYNIIMKNIRKQFK